MQVRQHGPYLDSEGEKMTSRKGTFAAVVAAAMLVVTSAPALAKGEGCAELWHRRNAIYADHGYCFRTARAIAVFGRGCFAPYGRLSVGAAQEVRRLQAMEARRGCPA